jgi:hypothetical protein
MQGKWIDGGKGGTQREKGMCRVDRPVSFERASRASVMSRKPSGMLPWMRVGR